MWMKRYTSNCTNRFLMQENKGMQSTSNPNFYQLLGLAMRAGKIISGEVLVLAGINQTHLLIITDDAAQHTLKKISAKARTYHVPLIQVQSRYDLGRAIGKEQRVVVGVTDKGFAKQLRRLNEM